jgi:hypothetical protein
MVVASSACRLAGRPAHFTTAFSTSRLIFLHRRNAQFRKLSILGQPHRTSSVGARPAALCAGPEPLQTYLMLLQEGTPYPCTGIPCRIRHSVFLIRILLVRLFWSTCVIRGLCRKSWLVFESCGWCSLWLVVSEVVASVLPWRVSAVSH